MAKAKRKNHGFKNKDRKELLRLEPLCVCCKREKATEADHILAMDFLRHAKTLNVTMNDTETNGGALCGKCHNLKSTTEAAIKPSDFEAVAAHFRKWFAVHFSPTGKRRTMKAVTIDKNANKARRIHRAKMNARIAKRDGNPEQEAHYHRLAAAARREK